MLVGAPPAARSVDPKTAKRIDAEIEKNKAEIVKIRRFIHMNPELGNREVETARLIAARLQPLGFEVRTGVAKTGVVAVLQGGQSGPAVAVRADMDALPVQETTNLPYKSLNAGVMHACGHDVHSSVVLGTALVLHALRDEPQGQRDLPLPARRGRPARGRGRRGGPHGPGRRPRRSRPPGRSSASTSGPRTSAPSSSPPAT
ncbi:MAG: M20/M25/M40 family metallo-hydrolase [Comamonadaceae bacterium]|nr:M20/M25/M40 family metallo-hydrolase [Comamonadaceae bacterium]